MAACKGQLPRARNCSPKPGSRRWVKAQRNRAIRRQGKANPDGPVLKYDGYAD